MSPSRHRGNGHAIRGQSAIEFTIAVVVLLLLFGGTFNLWLWFNRSLVWRQRGYDDTRAWWVNENTGVGDDPGRLDYYHPEPLMQ